MEKSELHTVSLDAARHEDDVPLLEMQMQQAPYKDDELAIEESQPSPPPTTTTSRLLSLHPAFYIIAWLSLSSGIIIFNKYILTNAKFHFPIVLTTWHLFFATIMTQLMARTTTMLDSRKKVPMTARKYCTSIVPIGVFFSLSLICGNLTYLYLNVAFIQMLKATTPVAVLLSSWAFRVAEPNLHTFFNVLVIVVGVGIASFGEISFNIIGFLYQLGGIVFEALRLTMVQKLLSADSDFKMDPMVSLYYFAPACTVMNALVAVVVEVPRMTLADVEHVGYMVLLANAFVAFILNVSTVLVIGKTSSLVLTLAGVLKTILLIFASMLLFNDMVSMLQYIGFSIALVALLYYQLGPEKLIGMFEPITRLFQPKPIVIA